MRASPGVALLAIMATGCGHAGGADTKSFTVGAFDRVALAGPDDVIVTTGPAAAIRAEGDADTLDKLTMQVVDGELRVGREKSAFGFFGWKTHRARVAVTVPALRGVTLSGAGKLTVDRVATPDFAGAISGAGDLRIAAIDVKNADLRISGAGGMTVAGKAEATRIDVSGAGDIHGDDLVSGTLALGMSGVGKVVTRVTGRATGRVSGVGKVRIIGTEDCNISTSGVGSVTCER